MQFLLIYYKISVALAVPLFCFVVFLVLFKSPSTMTNLKWHILNIQVTAFFETFYVCVLTAAQMLPYPIPHGAPTGILSTLLKIPSNVQVGLAILLIGLLLGSQIVAFVFRYHLLLPQSNISIIHWFIEHMQPFAVLCYGNGFFYGFLAYKSFLSEEETKKLIKKVDSKYTVPMFSTTINQDWSIITGSLVSAGYIFTLIVGGAMVKHSLFLLRKAAHTHSQQAVRFHKDAFKSLLFQIIFLYGAIVCPCFSIAFGLLIGINKFSPEHLEIAIPVCFSGYAIKSVAASVTACYTITPYREYIKKLVWYKKRKQNKVTVISDQTTDK